MHCFGKRTSYWNRCKTTASNFQLKNMSPMSKCLHLSSGSVSASSWCAPGIKQIDGSSRWSLPILWESRVEPPATGSQLLTLAWPSPGHMGSERMGVLSASGYLLLSLHDGWIDKKEKEEIEERKKTKWNKTRQALYWKMGLFYAMPFSNPLSWFLLPYR